MKRNEIIKTKNGIFRILAIDTDKVLAIDCIKKTMPKFYPSHFFEEGEILDKLPCVHPETEDLSPNHRKIAQERYTMIAGAVSVVDDIPKRNLMIEKSAEQFGMSKQSIRSFLCSYLVYQDIAVLTPKPSKEKALTQDQKNMRWALNKFFYTRNQNSLPTAFAMMLKERYCNAEGQLLDNHPSFNQFRYFYRKTRRLESYYISRNGIKNYQRNRRPLLGDGVQEFAPSIGTAMLDGTVCDIYLVNDKRQLVGRPVLIVACDANTSLCLGYTLLWEGGTYSLQTLMLNILEDKVALCERMGISITPEQWSVYQLPGIMITDGGSEYKGQTFEQIAELGVTLINLPAYRPDLKGPVEKLFDLVQSSYKDILKGKGIIMPDFQERGAHDYRKDAALTMQEFEKIVVRCIVHYNCERVVQNYPYTKKMLADNVPPYANSIWNWKKHETGANLIDVSKKDLVLTLLPRTKGKYTKQGLKVNGLRYCSDGYKEQFLQGGEALVTYNPDNCSKVWIKEQDGSFTEFCLIENRFSGMSLDTATDVKEQQKQLVKDAVRDSYQAKINLMSFVEAVASSDPVGDIKIKGARKAKMSEKKRSHKDIGGVLNG